MMARRNDEYVAGVWRMRFQSQAIVNEKAFGARVEIRLCLIK